MVQHSNSQMTFLILPFTPAPSTISCCINMVLKTYKRIFLIFFSFSFEILQDGRFYFTGCCSGGLQFLRLMKKMSLNIYCIKMPLVQGGYTLSALLLSKPQIMTKMPISMSFICIAIKNQIMYCEYSLKFEDCQTQRCTTAQPSKTRERDFTIGDMMGHSTVFPPIGIGPRK